jgi:hypothetical protein
VFAFKFLVVGFIALDIFEAFLWKITQQYCTCWLGILEVKSTRLLSVANHQKQWWIFKVRKKKAVQWLKLVFYTKQKSSFSEHRDIIYYIDEL